MLSISVCRRSPFGIGTKENWIFFFGSLSPRWCPGAPYGESDYTILLVVTHSGACIIHYTGCRGTSLSGIDVAESSPHFLSSDFLEGADWRKHLCGRMRRWNRQEVGAGGDTTTPNVKLQPLKPIGLPDLKILPRRFTLASFQSQLPLSARAGRKENRDQWNVSQSVFREHSAYWDIHCIP